MAKKGAVVFKCWECGAVHPKWLGRCPDCGQWNTLQEFIQDPNAVSAKLVGGTLAQKARPVPLATVQAQEAGRLQTGIGEFDRALGGGATKRSAILLGGEPGIGKSTLLIQAAANLSASQEGRILYASGEESASQIKGRADRLGLNSGKIEILCATRLEDILDALDKLNPVFVVVDSIQTVYSVEGGIIPGTVNQLKYCSNELIGWVKERDSVLVMTAHVTKDGNIAGPKALEHMVDTVLQFEGDQQYMYRIVRAIKNRFGSTAELGIYEMVQNGLRPVSNPSELLLSDIEQSEGLSGVAIGCAIEGVRPLLIEAQALVSTAAYGTPQRLATGFDTRRLNMLLAVLEKRIGFKLAQKDVYLNIAGGIRVTDPATDLSIISSILSSNVDSSIDRKTCMCGEVGLSGEIRPVSRILQRISEAEKLGFDTIIVPQSNMNGIDISKYSIHIRGVRKVEEAFRELFG